MKTRTTTGTTKSAARVHRPKNEKRLLPQHMPIPKKWRWHYGVLQRLRERLTKDRDDQAAEALEPLIPDTNDMADCATDEFDHDMALSILAQEQSALNEVDSAIRRIQEGSYGICEETRKPIPAARLRAVPWTRFRREVQERMEKEGLVARTCLPPPSDVHGPLSRGARPPSTPFPPLKRTKSERRAASQSAGTGDEPDRIP